MLRGSCKKTRVIPVEKDKKYLNLGCGKDLRNGWVNVDIQKHVGIQKSFDIEVYPYPFKDNEFDYILVDNVLEHILRIPPLIDELYRIAKPNAIIHIVVPYFNCAAAYNDPTHYHFFNKRTMELLFGKGSSYGLEKGVRFEIVKLSLEPTPPGKIILPFIREPLSFVLGSLIATIECKARVIKGRKL